MGGVRRVLGVIAVLGACAWAHAETVLPAQLMPLPIMAEKQIRELISDVSFQLETTAGFKRTAALEGAHAGLPPYPPNVTPVAVLKRGAGEYLRLGFVMPPRRVPQLWLQAFTLQHGDPVPVSDAEMQSIQASARSVLTESAKVLGRLRLTDLEAKPVLLSYVDADAALFVLRAMGYSAVTDTEPLPKDDWYKGEDVPPSAPSAPSDAMAQQTAQQYPSGYAPDGSRLGPKFPGIKYLPSSISFDRLPLIVRVPSTDPRNLGVVGADPNSQSQYYYNQPTSAIPSVAAPLAETIAAGTQELLVIFHPDYPEQFQKIKKVLQDSIDRPARQVYIEGLVVEVSRGAFNRLGVQWSARKGQSTYTLGTTQNLDASGSAATFQRNALDSLGNIIVSSVPRWQIYANIQALASQDKAEVLSRPSVITLDNRQATIRVGNDVPVVASRGFDRGIGYDYKPIPTGIMLNVRPRVSEDGQEISMLIDATVSNIVPNADLIVRDPNTDALVVEAPTVSTRRVQTYARIRDNMPLIIGGLMSRDVSNISDRVPGLGSIPVLGALFGNTKSEDDIREVIIVLTPSIVTEDARDAKMQYPKDDPRFDVTSTMLFKEKIRIGAEDIVDSAPFRNSERLVRYRDAANKAIDANPSLAAQPPFSQFAGNRVPGESIFVTGMMSRMLDRINAADAIPVASLKVFEGADPRLQRPVSVTQILARYGGGSDPQSFFARERGKALALVFRPGRSSATAADIIGETAPEIRLVDSPTRDTWRTLLWDLNQPDERGPRSAILIQDPEDLHRLQLAIATYNTIHANGGESMLAFDRWVPGRMIQLQEVTPNWERILDADMAREFFLGEHYYAYFRQEHARALEALERAMKSPAAQGLVLPTS